MAQSVPGWEGERALTGGVTEYDASYDQLSGRVYLAVVRKLPDENGFEKRSVNIFFPDGKMKKIADLQWEKRETSFPVHPGIAVSGGSVLLVYQTPGEKNRTIIHYHFSGSGRDSEGILEDKRGRNMMLPSVYASGDKTFNIVYNQAFSDNRYTLVSRSFSKGKPADDADSVDRQGNIGRGIFFPRFYTSGDNISLIYQSRREKNLRDELFLAVSKNGGRSYQTPVQLTDNNFNDFAPDLVFGNGNLYYVYQANPRKNWEIFLGSGTEAGKPEKISDSEANAYNPVIGYADRVGRVIAWQDYRDGQSRIYARFFDRSEIKRVYEEFAVSSKLASASKPRMFSIGGRVILYYIQGSTLYSRFLDNQASKLVLFSPTHPEGKASKKNEAVFRWEKPDDVSGIDSYAYFIDGKANSTPPIYNLSGERTEMKIGNIAGGKYFFHLRYRDLAGNESPIAHYSFLVDNLPPLAPEILSSTHQENIPGKGDLITFTFSSTDDSGIAGYRYELSQSPEVPLTTETKDERVQFHDLPPGRYYFRVQALDIAGNFSETSGFELVVRGMGNEGLSLFNSLRNEMNPGEKIRFQVLPKTRTPVFARYSLGKGPAKDLSDIENHTFTQENDLYIMEVETPEEPGVWVLSYEVHADDGYTLPVRHYYFKIPEKEKEEVKEEIVRPVNTVERNAAVYQLLNSATLIEITQEKGIYSLNFRYTGKEKPTGYAWSLSTSPENPGKTVNSLGGPEYLYLLPAGEYFINVRPVFGSRTGLLSREKLISAYDYKGHYVTLKRYAWGSQLRNATFLIVAGALFIVAVGTFIGNRRKLRFVLSRYRS